MGIFPRGWFKHEQFAVGCFMVNHEDSASKSAKLVISYGKLLISVHCGGKPSLLTTPKWSGTLGSLGPLGKLLILVCIINEIWALSQKKRRYRDTPQFDPSCNFATQDLGSHMAMKILCLSVVKGFFKKKTFKENIPYAPWCWNIYHHVPHKSASYVGK